MNVTMQELWPNDLLRALALASRCQRHFGNMLMKVLLPNADVMLETRSLPSAGFAAGLTLRFGMKR